MKEPALVAWYTRIDQMSQMYQENMQVWLSRLLEGCTSPCQSLSTSELLSNIWLPAVSDTLQELCLCTKMVFSM